MRTSDRGEFTPDFSQRHDDICIALTDPSLALRLVGRLIRQYPETWQPPVHHLDIAPESLKAIPKTEHLIWKGEGQYRVKVGSIDVVIPFYYSWLGDCTRVLSEGAVGVEVKTGRLQMGEIVRQVNVYRAYTPCNAWVLVSDQDIPADRAKFLAGQGICPISFDALTLGGGA